MTKLAAVSVALLALAASRLAAADSQADLAVAIGEKTSRTQQRIVEKLMTFKLGDACWTKLLERGNTGATLIASAAHDIARYAAAVTGDDWRAIENQTVNTKAKNRELAEGMVDAFAPAFHLTIAVEGDDCEASGNGLWLKYLGSVTGALEAYPPKSGKAFVTIQVKAKAKGVKTEVDKSGTKFTITGARDVEKSGWPASIDGPIKRVSVDPKK
jgi:hypothetical protein